MSSVPNPFDGRFDDKAWRYTHLYDVINKGGKRVPFIPNSIQHKIFASKNLRKIILKFRQPGVSTGCILDYFDDVLFTPNLTACILAHEKDGIEKLFRIARRAYDFMPDQIRPRLDRGGGSKYEMYFPAINSRIYCDLESRGDTIHRLHISEAAFIEKPERIKATLECVPIDSGRVNIESTPNGLGNWYYDTWFGSKNYEHFFFPWFIFPEYRIKTPPLKWTDEELIFAAKAKANYGVTVTDEQLAFRRMKQEDQKDKFIQEYPEDPYSCFLASGKTVMDLVRLAGILESLPEIHETEKIQLFDEPRKDVRYVIGADTSEGVSKGDYSVGKVFRVDTMTEVASVRGHFSPYDFAKQLQLLADRFTFGGRPVPLIAVERNNHGHAVLLQLGPGNDNYPNLYKHTDEKLGWLTNSVTRPIMFDAFIEGVHSGMVKLNDPQTVKECMTLIDNKGKIEAAEGKHDDSVVASCIAVQMAIKARKISDLYENIESRILL